MKRKIFIDEKILSALLASLSRVSKGKLRFFDDESQFYINADRRNLPFCRMLSRSPKSNALCTQCNENANAHCRETRASYCYFCHATLVEIMYPVVFEDVYVGHLSIGQFRSKHKTADAGFFDSLSALMGVNAERLIKAYASHPVINEEEIKGAQLLLEMTAERLCKEGVFHYGDYDVIYLVDQYIHNHLSEPLTLESIAKYVYMNPAYLSTIYCKATGKHLFSKIKEERILRAAYLFSITTLSVSEIANAVGFKDPNYFSKAFKAIIGCMPREYRVKLSKGELIF